MRYLIRILLGIILAIVIVFAISRTISWQDALTAIHVLSWSDIVWIVGVVLVTSMVQATRFFLILRFGNIHVSLKNTIRIFIASQSFTPLPAGEVGRAMLFKKELGIHLK